ncbi:hypothetical protein [Bradyrhizobium sp. CCGUVB23]|uniref:hypothetical protein n=1 Tax=Bradyrhizobium sp. CCGUVB23 TaxID=2949630 RepID=UPI0020B2D90C|nr:hypothetical protein [Bradyrhizobium sp. CCGUVB23]MCP3465674.1 hypothetical protein [Bradyrhizobium sp. CCGUVB23]
MIYLKAQAAITLRIDAIAAMQETISSAGSQMPRGSAIAIDINQRSLFEPSLLVDRYGFSSRRRIFDSRSGAGAKGAHADGMNGVTS